MNKLTYSQSCGLASQCIDGAGGSTLVCLSGSCTCNSLYYWTGTICTSINSYNGGSCTSNNQCDATKNLTCVTTTCTCANNLYWDGTVCQTRKLPTLTCTYSYQCVNNTVCSYLNSSSTSTTCNCYNAYYYDYTTQVCSKNCSIIYKKKFKLSLKATTLTQGLACISSYQCNSLLGLKCVSNLCNCQSGYIQCYLNFCNN